MGIFKAIREMFAGRSSSSAHVPNFQNDPVPITGVVEPSAPVVEAPLSDMAVLVNPDLVVVTEASPVHMETVQADVAADPPVEEVPAITPRRASGTRTRRSRKRH